jgi:hypothetical protein
MSENVNEANKRRRQRWTEVRLRMATDLTDLDRGARRVPDPG